MYSSNDDNVEKVNCMISF